MKVVKGKNGKPRICWERQDTIELVTSVVSAVVGTVLGLWILGLI